MDNFRNVGFSEFTISVVTKLRIVVIADKAVLTDYYYRAQVYEGNTMVKELRALDADGAKQVATKWIMDHYQVVTDYNVEEGYQPVDTDFVQMPKEDFDLLQEKLMILKENAKRINES